MAGKRQTQPNNGMIEPCARTLRSMITWKEDPRIRRLHSLGVGLLRIGLLYRPPLLASNDNRDADDASSPKSAAFEFRLETKDLSNTTRPLYSLSPGTSSLCFSTQSGDTCSKCTDLSFDRAVLEVQRSP